MGFNMRKRFRLGPLFINTNRGRITSWGWKWGRVTRNVTRETTTVDTPGPGSYTHRDRHRRNR